MNIKRITPPPPPIFIQMTFSRNEGWTILAALNDWVRMHPSASEVDEWRDWVKTLDKELRNL